MLRSLHIQNYAIIDHVELSFSDELTTITGETGAGKSIIIGAMSLLLGSRSDSSTLYAKLKKCAVEGVFDVAGYGLDEFFEEQGLDQEPVCTIRREVSAQGKSRAFINDTPVTLDVLRELSSKLVDLHRQHETLELSSDKFQLDVVDAFAGQITQVADFTTAFKALTSLETLLNNLRAENIKAQQDLDYQQFQLTELEEAKLQIGEQERLESELKMLNHAGETSEALVAARVAMSEGDTALLTILKSVESALRKAAGYDPRVQTLLDRVTIGRIELDDVSTEITRLNESGELDQSRLQLVSDRLDMIFRLQKKHHVVTVDQLIAKQHELAVTVKNIAGLDQRIEMLSTEASAKRKELVGKAGKLSENRSKSCAKLQEQVAALLPAVGLLNAVLKVDQMTDAESIGSLGADKIRFLFSANPGSAPVEIRKVASGGELSRLMLVIKSLIASSASMPTLIFDEVDEGVSGEVAKKVGTMLRELAASHQVICITHLPQIAAKGHRHYFVYKEVKAGRTITFVKSLGTGERVVEIAKMLSGEQPTTAALENARELLTLN